MHYLTSSDDSAFTRYLRKVQFAEARERTRPFVDNLAAEGIEGFRRERAAIMPLFERYARALQSEYGIDAMMHDYRYFASLTPEEVVSLVRLRLRHRAFISQPREPVEKKAVESDEFLAEFERWGDWANVGKCHLYRAELGPQLGETPEVSLAYRRRALREFRAVGETYMACQVMCEIGYQHQSAGRIDSMMHYYDGALGLARRSRIPDQTARALTFYAAYYAATGRLGLAHELYEQAIDVCQEYGGLHHQIRFVASSMAFHADIECWDVVARLSQRAQILEQLYRENKQDTVYYALARYRRARMLMARGNVEDAERLYGGVEGTLRPTRWNRQLLSDILARWSEGLIANGRPERAIPILRRGLEFARREKYDQSVPEIELLLARACLDLGRGEEAARHLRLFENAPREVPGDTLALFVERGILQARLAFLDAQPEERERALSRSLAQFVSTIARLEATPHAYLWIHRAAEYRRLLHDIGGDDPALGYGAELLWRDLGRLIGSKADTAPRSSPVALDTDAIEAALARGDLLALLRERAESGRAAIGNARAVHCLYRCTSEGTIRWTVSSNGISREAIRCSPQTLERLVSEVRGALAAGPGQPNAQPRPMPAAELRQLARLLLPPQILQHSASTKGRPLFISADGSLETVPFEALNVGAGEEYEPLLLRSDVAYVHRIGDGDRAAGAGSARAGDGRSRGRGLILLSAGGAPGSANGSFPRRLDAARSECARLASMDRAAAFLDGSQASRSDVMSALGDAPYVYIAAHTLREPAAPYLMSIALAPAPGDGDFEGSNLDFKDVRGVDLSRCRLAVLSGCSTGKPYVDLRAFGPALGDAFLDAGARSVVETFWDVRDEDAARLMTSFIELWKGEGASPVHALCEARRRVIRDAAGAGGPASWAAFAIETSGPGRD